ncbi:MAG: transglutaminase-like domain-containing protein [Candidatus Pacearchaeota archaeon]
MKKLVLILTVVLCLTLCDADIDKTTTFEVNISNTVSSTSGFSAELFIFPRNTETQQTTLVTEPGAQIQDNKILFSFEEGTQTLNVFSNVVVNFNLPKIKEHIDINKVIETNPHPEYLGATEHIDSDNLLIKNKAKQLKENAKSNNTLKILYELAEYVRKSIYYSPSYSQPQKASWILENKIGVCSHYTALFIAFSRALGIPARYISGIAYSSDEQKFSEHAWAEVYLENYGWIPYDVTFGQYGWLDSSHTLLKYGKDSAESSIEYKYRGILNSEKININAKITEKYGKIEIPFQISLNPYKKQVAFDSYVPLEVQIENKNDFYFNLPIYLVTAPGVYGETTQVAFLEPGQKQKIFFILRIPESTRLNECKYGCVATISVKDFFKNTATATIEISKHHQQITLEQAQDIINTNLQKTKFDFFCSPDKDIYYENESVQVRCLVNSQKKESFDICLDGNCKKVIQENSSIVYFDVPVKGIICARITQNQELVQTTCLNINVTTQPKIEIENVKSSYTKYGEPLKIYINFSSNNFLQGKIMLRNKKNEKIFEHDINISQGKNSIFLELSSLKLKLGTNVLDVVILYHDERINFSGESKKTFSLYIEDVNILKKIWLMFKKLFI